MVRRVRFVERLPIYIVLVSASTIWKLAGSFFFWPSTLRFRKRVRESTRRCSPSCLISWISVSKILSAEIFGFAV